MCKIKLIPRNKLSTAGDHAARAIGIWPDAPKACIKFDIKNSVIPVKIPVMMNANPDPERGRRMATPAAIRTMAENNAGCASKV